MFYIAPRVYGFFAPFILAFLIAIMLNPFVSFLERKIRIKRNVISFVTVVLMFAVVVSLLYWFVQTLIGEVVSLTGNIPALTEYFVLSYQRILQRFDWLTEYLPGNMEDALANFTGPLSQWLSERFAGNADGFLTNTKDVTIGIGNVVFSSMVFIVAAYFLTVDYPKIGVYFSRFSDSPVYKRFVILKNSAKAAFAGYVKAQILLSSIAFVVMFFALTIYRQDYAFLIALILALIDFLPFLGSSVVLVPWAIVCVLSGDAVKAVFLLSLCFVFFLIRRLAEPKIMSSQTGLSPFLALLSTFVGLKMAGVAGIILAPVITVVLISVIKSGIFDNAKKDFQEFFTLISKALQRE
jgi:sporulation integral membrane protein YtvI